MPPNVTGFMWYRGEGAKFKDNIAGFRMSTGHRAGPAYSGREQINFDGSLLIKKVTLKDTGIYTVVVYLPGSIKEIGFGRLNVYEPVSVPTLQASNTTVTENKDSVVLTCYTNAVSTQWFFNGMNLRLTERMKLMKLSWSNRTLTIDPVRREDAGNYQCEVSNPISSAESEAVELDIPPLVGPNSTISTVKLTPSPSQQGQWSCDDQWEHVLSFQESKLCPFSNGSCGGYLDTVLDSKNVQEDSHSSQECPPSKKQHKVTEHENAVVLTCYSTVILTQWFFNDMSL
ncbi:carcinoembryonic antigen-related cell adhesion molecule 21-like [Myotis myotis]|uniref:carcinoembryonic antigen-related cell adhesion molecule 21-like n=1 Tax=Myotis myotis TaxID=51298 RepID=UPI00174D1406|nr:carcinoembryonic antigen-related cell adhesion molecule 21-like [Myotis myotis]